MTHLEQEHKRREARALARTSPPGGWSGQQDDPSQHDKEAGHDSTVGG